MSKILNQNERQSVTFDEIVGTIQTDTHGFERHGNRDLRLPDRGHGNSELKVHTETFNNPFTAAQNRAAARDLVNQALEREVGASPARRIWRQAGLEGADRITVAQMGALNEGVQNHRTLVNTIQTQQQHWAGLRNGAPAAIAAPAWDGFQGADLAQMNISEQGSGGAVLTPTVVAKIEHQAYGNATKEVAQVAQAVCGLNAADCPLQFTPVEVYVSAESKQAARAKLQEKQDLIGEGTNEKLDDHLHGLNPASRGYAELSVHLATRVPGTPLNRLPVADKIALFKSPAFINDLGKAMPLCPVLGLGDHLAPNKVFDGPLARHAFGTGYQNVSNLILTSQSGRLAAIDGTPKVDQHTLRLGATDPDKALECLAEFVQQAAQSPAEFQRAVEQMINGGSTATPMSGVMQAMLTSGGEDDFLRPAEVEIFEEHVNDGEKQAFAAHLLRGAAEGLQYVNNHAEQLDTACHESSIRSQFNVDQTRNFVQRQQMANLRQGLGAINFNHLTANLDAVSQGQQAPHVMLALNFAAPAVVPLAPVVAPVALPVDHAAADALEGEAPEAAVDAGVAPVGGPAPAAAPVRRNSVGLAAGLEHIVPVNENPFVVRDRQAQNQRHSGGVAPPRR